MKYWTDRMTIKTLCTYLRDFWIKSKRVTSKNVFYISRPPGGAIQTDVENAEQRCFLGL